MFFERVMVIDLAQDAAFGILLQTHTETYVYIYVIYIYILLYDAALYSGICILELPLWGQVLATFLRSLGSFVDRGG